MRITFSIIFSFLLIQLLNAPDSEEFIRMNQSSVSAEIVKVIPHIIAFNDTITNDTLFEYDSSENVPVMYSRKIATGVCIKGECRPVKLELFWDCTGRYLGYKIPAGEFLSKTEHVKFGDADYDRLHEMLGNRQSALATYTYQDLARERDTTKNGVDAVTSATMSALLDYIVEGAVYTTYTLWHIVYGQTKREVEKITMEKLTPKSTFEILNSDLPENKIWMLNHFPKSMTFTPELQNIILEFISGNDVYLAERALNSLPATQLTDSVQLKLAEIFKTTGQIQQRFILQKLNETHSLNHEAASEISSEIATLNLSLARQVLELFTKKDVDDEQVSGNVSELLENNNRNISELAYKFLESCSNLSRETQRRMVKYGKNRN